MLQHFSVLIKKNNISIICTFEILSLTLQTVKQQTINIMLKKLFFFSILSLCLFSCSSDEEASMEQICKSELIGKWKLYEINYTSSGMKEIPEGESTLTFTSSTIKRENKISTGETSVLEKYEIKDVKQSDATTSFILIEKSDIGTEENDCEIEDGVLTIHFYGCITWGTYKYKKVK